MVVTLETKKDMRELQKSEEYTVLIELYVVVVHVLVYGESSFVL